MKSAFGNKLLKIYTGRQLLINKIFAIFYSELIHVFTVVYTQVFVKKGR